MVVPLDILMVDWSVGRKAESLEHLWVAPKADLMEHHSADRSAVDSVGWSAVKKECRSAANLVVCLADRSVVL